MQTVEEKRSKDAARQRKYRSENPEKMRGMWRKYRATKTGLITQLLNNARDRAKKNKLPFELDREWVDDRLIIGLCELTGLPFDLEPGSARGAYRARPFAPSIDKIVPELGYTPENCRLICFCVNMARSDWGDEVLLKVAKALINK